MDQELETQERKNVIIISGAETFSVKGIETKLMDIGVDSSYVITKLKNLEERVEGADLFVLYMDQSIGGNADVLVFLNDTCTE